MCGIFFYRSNKSINGKIKKKLEKQFNKISHRGPDQKQIKYYNNNVMVGFHRLAVIDPEPSGIQPFESADKRFISVCNGEIYNYKLLKEKLDYVDFKTHNDCEVIVHLFEYLIKQFDPQIAMEKFCLELDGEYSLIIYDTHTKITYFATDELSIRPLFYGYSETGDFYIASEQKSLILCHDIFRLKASNFGIFDGNISSTVNCYRYYDINKIMPKYIPFKDAAIKLRDLLIENVKNKIHPEREFVFLLSGGVDSSLICSIASKLLYPTRIKTFTVGFNSDAPDILAARKVAKHIDSIHTEFICSYQEGIDLLPSVVYYTESWDQTSIRASTIMMLCIKKIREKHPDVAVILNGDVSDELLRGYLYNKKTPSLKEGRKDHIMRLEDIHMFDGLRSDRSNARYSMEARFPFFSRDLLTFIFELPMEYLNPKHNNNIEKYILRQAFDPSNNDGYNFLPTEILYAKKEAFSDGTSVKSGWKDHLIKYCEQQVTDSRFESRHELYKYCTPQTKEDFYYRELFDEYEYNPETIKYKWLSSWCGNITDSSASTLDVY